MSKATCTTTGCEKKQKARGLCAPHYSAWYRKREGWQRTSYERKCCVCDATFTSTSPTARYCTTGKDSCEAAAKVARGGRQERERRERWARAQRKLEKAAAGAMGSGWIAGACNECGTSFIARAHSVWPSRFCSLPCQNKATRRRGRKKHRVKHGRLDQMSKRARHYGVEYEPISRQKVFERDGYRCGICRKATKRKASVPDRQAPTIDHIVPMSRGGAHLYVNVQCACFECNWRKAAGAANDQLLLVG